MDKPSPDDFVAADSSPASMEQRTSDSPIETDRSQSARRADLAVGGSAIDLATTAAGQVLHVGCGSYTPDKLDEMFRNPHWREIRLDIDPRVEPDVVASITDMHEIADATVDAVYSSHNIEHLYPHDVPVALREFHRVLHPDGFALVKLPDLQEVARHIAEGRLEEPLYLSPLGPIAALDVLYGYRPSLAHGNLFMAHRTGFTAATLGTALIAASFAAVMVQRDLATYSLTAIAFCNRPNDEQISDWRSRLQPSAERPTVLYCRTPDR